MAEIGKMQGGDHSESLSSGNSSFGSDSVDKNTCFLCHGRGHWARHCISLPAQYLNEKAPKCYSCGGVGHFARCCPTVILSHYGGFPADFPPIHPTPGTRQRAVSDPRGSTVFYPPYMDPFAYPYGLESGVVPRYFIPEQDFTGPHQLIMPAPVYLPSKSSPLIGNVVTEMDLGMDSSVAAPARVPNETGEEYAAVASPDSTAATC